MPDQFVPCPHCDQPVSPKATVCRHCSQAINQPEERQRFGWWRKLSRRQKIIFTPLLLLFCCCSSIMMLAAVDSGLRDAGVLPTHTATPPPTNTATATQTAVPTNTAIPTETLEPTFTPIPTDTLEPTETPVPTNTVQPTATSTPQATHTATAVPPTATATLAVPRVVIDTVNKQDEYVDIWNAGGAAQNLAGWVLVSEKGPQRCPLAGVLEPGMTLRIWALAEDAAQGGYNCGFGNNIWNNSESDPAVLYDANGVEVDRN